MRYCVLYPKAENVHLTKDVGMIAYKLHKNYGYDSCVACYKNGEYEYINNEVYGLKLDFIENKFFHLINIFLYLKKHSKKIDVLQIFHVTAASVFYALFYKLFNKKGIIFLKLDSTEKLIDRIKNMKNWEKLILDFFLKKVDIIGSEQKKIYNELVKILIENQHKIMHIPNGIDFQSRYFTESYDYDSKENVILNVGRIGSAEKASEVLLKAFVSIDKETRKSWKLVFVGEVEKNFKKMLVSFFENNPEEKTNIVFKGAVYDRKELYNEYKKAKIFCCTSKFESFGISLIEAAACGDVIASTKVGIAEEMLSLKNGEFLGIEDVEGTKEALIKLISSNKLKNYSEITEQLCRKNYNWDIMVKKLDERIKYLRGKNKYD